MKNQTELLYVGTEYEKDMNIAEVMPIHTSTAYVIKGLGDYDKAVAGKSYYYQRSCNPNRDALGEAISLLENAERTLVASSGMAAISTTLLSLLDKGDHVVFSSSIYGETIELAENILKNKGIEYSFCDFSNLKTLEENIKINTKLLYFEVIANPLIQIIDVEKVIEIAKSKNIFTVVDSTFTTPFLIKPLDYGVDIVIHSLTKFINGHSDVTAGSISSSEKIMKRIEPNFLLLGGSCDSFSSYLCLRSIRTFNIRMKVHNENAKQLVELIENHPAVKYINYPSANGYSQKELAQKLLGDNYGAMLSIRVKDDKELVDKFIKKLKLVKYLGTLGGYRTSFAHPATAFRSEFTQEELEKMGMYEGLLRFSVGLEDIKDIAEDINNALNVFL